MRYALINVCLICSLWSKLSDYDIKVKESPFLDSKLFREDEIFRKWSDEIYNLLGDMMGGIEQSQLTFLQGFKIIKKPKYVLLLKQFLIMKKVMLINQKYGW